MPIHYRNSPVNEPFLFDSIGCGWSQDRVLRPNGFPLYHYLQTEQGCGTVKIPGAQYVLNEGEGILISPFLHHSYARDTDEWLTAFATFTGTIDNSILETNRWEDTMMEAKTLPACPVETTLTLISDKLKNK